MVVDEHTRLLGQCMPMARTCYCNCLRVADVEAPSMARRRRCRCARRSSLGSIATLSPLPLFGAHIDRMGDSAGAGDSWRAALKAGMRLPLAALLVGGGACRRPLPPAALPRDSGMASTCTSTSSMLPKGDSIAALNSVSKRGTVGVPCALSISHACSCEADTEPPLRRTKSAASASTV